VSTRVNGPPPDLADAVPASERRSGRPSRVLAVRDRLETWPAWAVLLGFFALTRLFTAGAIETAALCCQNPAGVQTLTPGYSDMIGIWDGRWYQRIVEHGYPADLPVDQDTGLVTYSAWAFYPVFPFAVRALVSVGIPFAVAAVVLNLALSAAAVLLIWKVLSSAATTVLQRRMALLATLLWCLHPATAILQVAYSEPMACVEVAGFLLLLMRRRYAWAALVVVVLGFTRAAAPPLAVVALVHLVVRWKAERSGGSPLAGQRASAAVLVLATAVSSISWPLYVGLSTGQLLGFFRVQAAWGQRPDRGPFLAWVSWAWDHQGLVGVLLLFGLVAAYISLVMGRHGAFLAMEVRAWALAYPLFLLAVVRPITSMWRFMLLDFPVAAILVSLAVRGADGGHVTSGWRRRLALTTVALLAGVLTWTLTLLTYLPWAGRPP
jgi:hypothetical protein